MLDTIWQDVGYAARSLRRSPGFALLATVTLAVVIGANAAVYSIVDTVLLRPLAYKEPDRLVVIHDTVPRLGRVPINAGEFEQLAKANRQFESMALVGFAPAIITGRGAAERVDAVRVSPALFHLLGVGAAAGRVLDRGDDVIGRDGVVVLGNDVWRRRYGSDPSIVGRKITINGKPHTVVGVLPASFRFPRLDELLAMPIASGRPDLWLPFAITDADRSENSFVALARLAPGVTAAQARSEVDAIQRAAGRQFNPPLELGADVVPMRTQVTREAGQYLVFLWAGALVVLAIASVNIAGLLSSRGLRRARELAVRTTMGATTGRLIRQVVIEALVLTTIGASAGLALAYAVVPVVLAAAPSGVPRVDEVAVDGSAVAFAASLALIMGVMTGLVPGLRAGRATPTAALHTRTGITDTHKDQSVSRVLLIAQVALTIVSVACAALLVQSFANVLAVDRGFDDRNVVSIEVAAASPRYLDRDARAALVRTAIDRLRTIPGVNDVGIANKLPLNGVAMNSIVAAVGTENAPIPMTERPLGDIRSVNADYFRTLAIPLLNGRLFDEGERDRDAAIVSAAMARRTWPGQDPIGRGFRLSLDPQRVFHVVGVAGDVRAMGPDRDHPLSVYLPYSHGYLNNMMFAVRSNVAAEALAPALRTALHGIDPELAVSQIRPMTDAVADAVATRRFEALVLTSFGVVALLLAAIGIYGVLAFAVARRTREIGVRLALGAAPARVRRMVLRDAAAIVALGAAVGVPAAGAAGFALRGLLFGVAPQDPAVLVTAVVALALAAVTGAYVPARRAAAVDPIVSLRAE